ncbi:phosphate acetyltransferase [Natronospora cellulosivora (SeqCode)]
MDLLTSFKRKAQEDKKKIVLAEGNEARVIRAAGLILQDNIADLYILGDVEEMKSIAKEVGVNIDNATLINPKDSDLLDEFSNLFFELRKHKGISEDYARSQVVNPLYFGTMLVHTDRAAGMVAGSINSTGDVLRPAFQIIKTKPGVSVVSGAFIMQVPDVEYGNNGAFIFGDCGVNPNPNAEQLAEIAISSAETAKCLLDIEPIVALLSFSTKGSAKHELVDKVVEATGIANQKAPQLKLDGELQADAALIDAIAKTKCPDSDVAGKANVLIFPDLQSGNIAYKLTQRLAKAEALGPILQGIAKPINDLSRGCSVDDIINIVAITSVQASN